MNLSLITSYHVLVSHNSQNHVFLKQVAKKEIEGLKAVYGFLS